MSAFPPEADIRQRIEHVCFVPISGLGQKREASDSEPRSSQTRSLKRSPGLRGEPWGPGLPVPFGGNL